jgi:dGTPase
MQAKIDREKQIEILRGRLAESVKKRNDTVFHPSGIKYNHAGTSRDRFEAGEPLANPFQIDKERIVMCKAFRRLKHKTQVFWSPRNDHFRTRLTHTIELAQTADLIGSLLGLNTDLIEAIAFGHDIGSPPFGHAGQRALQFWLSRYHEEQERRPPEERSSDYDKAKEQLAFDRHAWAWKILQQYEEPYGQPGVPGLNLTHLTQDGIKNPRLVNSTSLEAQVVGLADDLTWINHDAEDFEQAGINLSDASFEAIRALGATRNDRMERAVRDILCSSLSGNCRAVTASPELLNVLNVIAEAQDEVFSHGKLWRRHEEGARVIIEHLMDWYMIEDATEIRTTISRLVKAGERLELEDEDISFLRRWRVEGISRLEAAVDAIVKMSDTFALDLYRHIYSPEILDYHF